MEEIKEIIEIKERTCKSKIEEWLLYLSAKALVIHQTLITDTDPDPDPNHNFTLSLILFLFI